MMSKNDSVGIAGSSSASLFRSAPAYKSKPLRKTYLIVPFKDDKGVSIAKPECIEDKMSEILALNFDDVKLSNLIEKGVEPHSLDMIDSQKLGVDSGVDQLAHQIMNNAREYVVLPKSE